MKKRLIWLTSLGFVVLLTTITPASAQRSEYCKEHDKAVERGEKRGVCVDIHGKSEAVDKPERPDRPDHSDYSGSSVTNSYDQYKQT